jgi:hypothetical protein
MLATAALTSKIAQQVSEALLTEVICIAVQGGGTGSLNTMWALKNFRQKDEVGGGGGYSTPCPAMVICLYGVPDTITSDRGREFVNSVVANLAKTMGFRQIFTSAYCPVTCYR